MSSLPSSTPENPSATPRALWWFAGLLVVITLMSGMVFSWPLLRFVDLDVNTAATIVLMGWGPWALVIGLIIVVAAFAPMDHRTWKRSLPLHIAACASLTLGAYMVGEAIDPFAPPDNNNRRWGPGPPPPGDARTTEDPGGRSTGTTQSPGSTEEDATERFLPNFERRDMGRDLRRSSGESPAFVIGGFFARRSPKELAMMMLARSFRSGFIVPIYLLGVAATQALRNHRRAVETERRAERSQRQLDRARLLALQSQLQPHFLFNTLNTITSFVEEKPRVAEEMLCALSSLLRRVLSLSEQTEISLSEELELVDLYLDIQRQRFDARLAIERTIDERLLRAQVPPLLLQPIVENAIHHGLTRSTTPACIELRVEEINHRLRLSVIDHHTAPQRIDQPEAPHHGVGLRNLANRLTTLYPDAAELHARPRLDGGYLTEVNLPLRLPPAPLSPEPPITIPCES